MRFYNLTVVNCDARQNIVQNSIIEIFYCILKMQLLRLSCEAKYLSTQLKGPWSQITVVGC